MTQDVWLSKHPYLRSIADFHEQVGAAADGVPIAGAQVPNWKSYMGDYQAGIPLLRSSHAIDLDPAEPIVVSLVERLASKPLPEKLAVECRVLDTLLHSELNAPHRAVAWLLKSEDYQPAHPGLLRKHLCLTTNQNFCER